VDRDRGDDHAEGQGRQAVEVAREAAEREGERRRQQPDEQGEADDPALGRDRHRCRVRGGCVRLLAFQPGQVGVRVLEAAEADTGDGVVHRDVESAPDERAAAARRALAGAVAEDVVTDARDRQRGRTDHQRGSNRERDPAAAPGEDREEHDADRERGEARLRVREVEAGPDHCDRGGCAEQHAQLAHEQHDHQQREDRDDEEAAVDGRVPEDGVDAEERRVRVRDEQLRVPEHVARLVLVDPDRREDDGHRRQLDEQTERDQSRPHEPGEHDREQAERQVEEEELDRSLPHVLRPEHRDPAPADERRERPGDDSQLLHALVALPELPRKEERRGRDDEVHRHEQVGLGRADVDVDPGGDARERCERKQVRPASDQVGAGYRQQDAEDRGGSQQRPVPVRGEVAGEHEAPDGPGAEPGEPPGPARADEQRRQAEAADDPGDLRAHGVTTTTARATWPSVATRRT